MNRLLRFLLFFIPLAVAGQNTDSLFRKLKQPGLDDTAKIATLVRLSDIYRESDLDKAISLAQQAIMLADSIHDNGNYKASALYSLGTALNWSGSFDSAVIVLTQAKEIFSKSGNLSRQAACLNGLGNAYAQQGNYTGALNSFFASLSISTRQGDEKRQSIVMSNLANVYANMDDGANSVKYYRKSIALKEKVGDYPGIITAYINMGGVLLDLGQINEADNCAIRAGDLIRQYGKRTDSSYLFSLQGKTFLDRKQYSLALEKFEAGKKIAEETGDIPSMVTCLLETGLTYTSMKDTVRAAPYFREGLDRLREMGELPVIEDAYEAMADAYAEAGYTDKSYSLLKTLLSMQDTVHSRELSELIARNEAIYNKERTQHELDNYKKNAEINDLQLQRSRWLIIVLVLAVIAVLLIVGFLVNRNRVKQLVNDQLEKHNAEITTQKNAITDSINYAKKIQDSILPPDSLVHRILPDSFILYIPKDVVSGDFYWVEQRDGLAVFAAVDCTGHGVPGALMSVIGFNLLTQAVNELGLTKPSDILHHLDFGVNKFLRQSGEGGLVKDGMDLAVCTLDPVTRKLQYAGVFNPAYIVHNGKLEQIKPDKFPIGINTDGVTDDYTNNEIQLSGGDMIYLFSDGYADQFGGPVGKKFMYKRFRELLLEISSLPTAEQKQKLSDAFYQWKSGQEQVDDIIVIGVRVS